ISQTGKSIRATANHPFLTPYGWKRLEELSRGDVVAGVVAVANEPSADLIPVHVGSRDEGTSLRPSTVWPYGVVVGESIRSIEPAGEEEVFDLRVPGSGNFIADGFVVHNSGAIEQDAD